MPFHKEISTTTPKIVSISGYFCEKMKIHIQTKQRYLFKSMQEKISTAPPNNMTRINVYTLPQDAKPIKKSNNGQFF